MGIMDQEDRAAIESDQRVERMDRVAVLWGEITAATRAFLAALAESDRHRDWAEEGFGTCAEWLAWRIGITRNTANEKVRAARALEDLPLISEAMGRGEVSFSKVRALTRVATPENEAELLELARAGSAANLERIVRGWKTLCRGEEARVERARFAARHFSLFPDDDGMYVVKGRLPPEVAAVLMRAVEAASDALFRERRSGPGSRDPCGPAENPSGPAADPSRPPDDPPEAAQLRADALGLVAERALSTGFGDDAPVSGSRAERYQVVLHVEEATLREDCELGMSEMEDGTRVTAETARRLACDASRVDLRNGAEVRMGAEARNGEGARANVPSRVIGPGRKTRTVPPALRRALEARDRGCRFPGCGLRFTDAHHIRHWADGGATRIDNLVLLCRRHHRKVHEEGRRICMDQKRRVVIFTPTGRVLANAPEPASLGSDPMKDLVRRNRERGVRPGPLVGAPRWKRDRDIPWGIEAAAREALDNEPVDDEPLDDEPLDGEPVESEALDNEQVEGAALALSR